METVLKVKSYIHKYIFRGNASHSICFYHTYTREYFRDEQISLYALANTAPRGTSSQPRTRPMEKYSLCRNNLIKAI